MADNWGQSLIPGLTYRRMFRTVDFNGENVSFAGSPTPAIATYKGSDLVESSAGLTLTLDHDSRSGLHRIDIDLSNAFFVEDESYTIIITAGTVDGTDLTGTPLGFFDTYNLSGLPIRNRPYSDISFPMFLVSNGDPAPGLTGFTVTRSIDGGAHGAAGGTVSEIGAGEYSYDAVAADMNGKKITFRFQAATADDTFYTVRTVG